MARTKSGTRRTPTVREARAADARAQESADRVSRMTPEERAELLAHYDAFLVETAVRRRRGYFALGASAPGAPAASSASSSSASTTVRPSSLYAFSLPRLIQRRIVSSHLPARLPAAVSVK